MYHDMHTKGARHVTNNLCTCTTHVHLTVQLQTFCFIMSYTLQVVCKALDPGEIKQATAEVFSEYPGGTLPTGGLKCYSHVCAPHAAVAVALAADYCMQLM